MLKTKRAQPNLSETERTIDEAIQRAYKAYGSDLSAFFADVQRQLNRSKNSSLPKPVKQVTGDQGKS